MRKTRRILLFAIVSVLLIVLCISIMQICKIYREYAEESRQHQELLAYKPTEPTPPDSNVAESGNAIINQSVVDLKEHYPDTVGWLTIDGTKIDYPFVQAEDNQTYLNRDMDLNYLVSGAIFVDYRNSPDFTDFSTILYGHQMKNDSMFGTMDWFRNDDFFLNNSTGSIYLPNKILNLNIVAVLVIKSDDKRIYDLGVDTDDEKEDFIAYIYENAEQLRGGVELTPQDSFVILSTCVYDFDGARMVLVTRIMNE